MPPIHRPTIRDVAQRAGVSKSLVSLVLNGSDRVSGPKRAAVMSAIAELGYRPNAAARNLGSSKTNAVGVLLNDLRNPWFVDCLDGLAAVFHANDTNMFLADARLDRRMGDRLLGGFLEFRVDGLVIVGSVESSPMIDNAVATVPTVVAASRDLGSPHLDVVANDDAEGTRRAVAHLLELGHTRIAHVAGATGEVARIRHETFVDTMTTADLPVHVERTDMTEDGGYRAGVRLLTRAEPPTAIFAVNDVTAVGVLSAADELGVNVPRQLSLVGYDNTALAKIRHISLTTIDNASYDVGRQAALALLGRIESPDRPGALELLTPSLRVRDSSGPPPG